MFMVQALEQALQAFRSEEVPVGAVIVNRATRTVLTSAYNQVEKTANPIYHAEIIAINQACNLLGSKYLYGHDIYVTLEPCTMCATALAYARVDRIFFGAYDKKFGALENGVRLFYNTVIYHKPEIYGGIMELQSKKLLQKFFDNLRKKNKQIILS
ncbi:cytidine and deoxycytidylate deaminase [Orientia chuto str. Dubai]|uniref:tRNA-specific adenosine deaminase n=1 Tax=Orientia chuto str. Dubai TaxID=1359168 RepID=A0A0F3MLV0_9RICK|nr:nucleoside deaminase [Candidatus Orientia mediorientalis]KJV56748.1 cytidine and deoxycytidylate deaminase [Orientia chuto str. Dubai]